MLQSIYHLPSNDLIPRKAQHNRFSVSKLSSETIQTLPEYSSPPRWNTCGPLPSSDSDRPPDYPETADEADADTDGDHEEHIIHHRPDLPFPQRLHTHIRRRKRGRTAVPDPFLDTLLERSVQALEMSNALLRTTMSAQSSLSALLSSEDDSDHFLEARARNLSTRIRVSSGVHETWMEHLEEISDGVDKLFGEDCRGSLDEGVVSQSLPTSYFPPDLRHRRKPSIVGLGGDSKSHLRYSHPTRDALVAPVPRALTQYVESTADPSLITLPSTLGLRASGSCHSIQSGELLCAHRQVAQPALTAKKLARTELESDTPAYHLLSNLVKRSGSLTPPPRSLHFHHRCASASPTGTGPRAKSSFSPSFARSLSVSRGRNRSELQIQTRYFPETSCTSPMPSSSPCTMPTDEEPSTSSSESSDRPTGYRTVQSLRKILSDHPSSSSVDTFQRRAPKFHRAPLFLPVTPPPAPTQGVSTATASISRLYTKGRHSMSTRPPSPPTHSSLKVRSVPPTPSPSPSTMSLSEVFGNGVARMMGSRPSTRAPTPKRISFAELPESYSGRHATSKLREGRSRKKSKQGKGNDGGGSGDWLGAFFRGGLSSGGLGSAGSREERMEERMARGWGSRPGYGTLDDWAV